MEVKIAAARDAIARFEEWKCEATFAAMVVAVSDAAEVTRKVAQDRCEKKYGRMYAREVL